MEDLKITRFLGANLNDTSMQIGEASEIINFRITDDYKAKKREGYKQYIAASQSGGRIRNMWYGKISGTYYHIFIRDGKVYKNGSPNPTEIGTITDSYVEIFEFQGILYFLGGSSYQKWTGTGNLATVDGYIPLIAVSTPPAGGGTPYENINLLTGKKRQRFSPDGVETEYFIAEKSVTSIDIVKLNGVTLTPTTDYTVDLTNGKVTFVVVPVAGTPDAVEIYWTKGTGSRTEITNQKYEISYGGTNDTRVMLYGNGNKIIFTALANGVPSAEYFAANNIINVSNVSDTVTWLCKQYDRLIIYTDRNSWYTVYSYDDSLGSVFPLYPLNDKIGSITKGALLQNNPFTLFNGLWEWVSTTVRDERNAEYKSSRIRKELDNIDLSTSLTYDYETKSELWICNGNSIWIYNYRLDVFYKFILADTPTCFININNTIYFGTTTGKIMQFQYNITNPNGTVNFDARTDNGTAIQAKMVLGFMDFSAAHLRKFLQLGFISIYPDTRCSISLKWESDRDIGEIPLAPNYNFINFNDIDFSKLTFFTNYNPQPFKLKINAKKFSVIKFILENNQLDETVTIVSFVLPVVFGGTVK